MDDNLVVILAHEFPVSDLRKIIATDITLMSKEVFMVAYVLSSYEGEHLRRLADRLSKMNDEV